MLVNKVNKKSEDQAQNAGRKVLQKILDKNFNRS